MAPSIPTHRPLVTPARLAVMTLVLAMIGFGVAIGIA
jgi:hypothetical protein